MLNGAADLQLAAQMLGAEAPTRHTQLRLARIISTVAGTMHQHAPVLARGNGGTVYAALRTRAAANHAKRAEHRRAHPYQRGAATNLGSRVPLASLDLNLLGQVGTPTRPYRTQPQRVAVDGVPECPDPLAGGRYTKPEYVAIFLAQAKDDEQRAKACSDGGRPAPRGRCKCLHRDMERRRIAPCSYEYTMREVRSQLKHGRRKTIRSFGVTGAPAVVSFDAITDVASSMPSSGATFGEEELDALIVNERLAAAVAAGLSTAVAATPVSDATKRRYLCTIQSVAGVRKESHPRKKSEARHIKENSLMEAVSAAAAMGATRFEIDVDGVPGTKYKDPLWQAVSDLHGGLPIKATLPNFIVYSDESKVYVASLPLPFACSLFPFC